MRGFEHRERCSKERRHNDDRSRGLSHHSTGVDAGGLDFRVRYGTGYYPPLWSCSTFFRMCELICLIEQRPTQGSICEFLMLGISATGLNTSVETSVLTPAVYQSRLYESPEVPRLSGDFELRCFQLLSAWSVATQHCLVRQLVN